MDINTFYLNRINRTGNINRDRNIKCKKSKEGLDIL